MEQVTRIPEVVKLHLKDAMPESIRSGLVKGCYKDFLDAGKTVTNVQMSRDTLKKVKKGYLGDCQIDPETIKVVKDLPEGTIIFNG